jgi:hypothetical protein
MNGALRLRARSFTKIWLDMGSFPSDVSRISRLKQTGNASAKQ